jgi:hypothetical protein
MDKIIKGSKIKNNKLGTFHIVESVEIYDDVTLVYTEDVKCFPIKEIEHTVTLHEKLCNLFLSLIHPNEVTCNPDKETTDELDRLLTSKYTPEMIEEDFDRMLKDLKSKK